jgi:hypothetical protein
MLKVLSEPSATAVATAAFTGLRLGELRGLTWRSEITPHNLVNDGNFGFWLAFVLIFFKSNRRKSVGAVGDPAGLDNLKPGRTTSISFGSGRAGEASLMGEGSSRSPLLPRLGNEG